MTVKRYSDYDPFAWVYNKHWGDRFTPTALAVMEELLLPRLPVQARILDLCCGTGQLAWVLSERGYQVTGIDGSEEMLHFARENAPGAKFILDDARSFKLPGLYHGVICVFDSLNHIMSVEELTSVFRSVSSALRENGLFLFDLNLEGGYKVHWNGVFGIIEDDHVCVTRNSYDTESKTARFEATIFYLQEGWQRSDVTLLQKCYSVTEVRRALKVAGLADVHTYAYNKQEGLQELTGGAERAFFISQKPDKRTGEKS
jgi:SAM-dependent methyltransferase